MNPDVKLRAWWAHRQGLDGSLAGQSAAGILQRTGWARSVGGVGPYLTLFSRGGLSREAADAAVAAVEIHELPSARGCTYVVPAADFAVALRSAPAEDAEMSVARKLGVTDREVDRLCEAVLDALAGAPLAPDALKEAVGGAVRSLGAKGTRKGLTSTMPLALGRLQSAGDIRRIPVNGRLDQQRYRYARWTPNPLARRSMGREEALVELARRYFRWIAPASVAEFQWFAGISGKAANAAVGELGLAALDETGLMFPDDLDAFRAFAVPRAACYAAVSSLDGISHLRRDVKGLIDPADAERLWPGAKKATHLGGLSDLPAHAIVDRGRLVGLWEFDPERGDVAWWPFVAPDAAMKAAVQRTEAFVRDQLGDARSFSLDSPKSRQPRIAALRAAARR
jgi:hypothetical protein